MAVESLRAGQRAWRFEPFCSVRGHYDHSIRGYGEVSYKIHAVWAGNRLPSGDLRYHLTSSNFFKKALPVAV